LRAVNVSIATEVRPIGAEPIGALKLRSGTPCNWRSITVWSERDSTPANRRIPLECVARDSTDVHQADKIQCAAERVRGVAHEIVPLDLRVCTGSTTIESHIHGPAATAGVARVSIKGVLNESVVDQLKRGAS
jgi:hypothetical protein